MSASPAGSGSRKPTPHEATLARSRGGSSSRPQSKSSVHEDSDEPSSEEDNPFRLPDGEGIFTLKQLKRHDTQRRTRMHAASHERHNKFMAQMRRREETRLRAEEAETARQKATRELVSQASLSIRNRSGKENLTEMIRNKREMFLIQFSLGVKRDEMRKLEEEAHRRETGAVAESQMLTEEAQRFEEFLLYSSDRVTKLQKEVTDQAKWVDNLEAEIRKLDEQLKDVATKSAELERKHAKYSDYKDFLRQLTPKEWIDEQNNIKSARQVARQDAKLKAKAERAAARAAERERRALERAAVANLARPMRVAGMVSASDVAGGATPTEFARTTTRLSNPATRPASTSFSNAAALAAAAAMDAEASASASALAVAVGDSLSSSSSCGSDDISSGLEIPMYFQSTEALVQVFHDLEKSDLQMVTQAHDTEGALDMLRVVFSAAIAERDSQIALLKAKSHQHSLEIERDEDSLRRAERVKEDFDAQAVAVPKAQLDALLKRIEALYRRCIVRSDDDLTAHIMEPEEMLAAVERGLADMRQTLATEFAGEADKLSKRMAEIHKDRVKKSRSSNWEAQERLREAKKAERSHAKRDRGGVAIRMGKPLMQRHNHFVQKKASGNEEEKKKDEKEFRDFFM